MHPNAHSQDLALSRAMLSSHAVLENLAPLEKDAFRTMHEVRDPDDCHETGGPRNVERSSTALSAIIDRASTFMHAHIALLH